MKSTFVFDGSAKPPAMRAKGYALENGRYVLQDFHRLTVHGHPFDTKTSTYGAGGIYSTTNDLYNFMNSAFYGDALSLRLRTLMTAPRTTGVGKAEVENTIGHGMGWFVSQRYKTTLLWNTGDTGQQKSVILHIPKEHLSVIILSAGGGREPEDIALQITDHLLSKKEN